MTGRPHLDICFPHKSDVPPHFLLYTVCARKTSSEGISVEQYAKLDEKGPVGVF